MTRTIIAGGRDLPEESEADRIDREISASLRRPQSQTERAYLAVLVDQRARSMWPTLMRARELVGPVEVEG
jgi:hypothetical protein